MATTYNVTIPNDFAWHEVGDATKVRVLENPQPVDAVEFALGTVGTAPAADIIGHVLQSRNYASPGLDAKESFAAGVAVFVRHRWRHPITLVVSEL